MLAQSIKGRAAVAAATATTGNDTIRMGVTARGEDLVTQAFKGTKLVGESQPYPATDKDSPAADIVSAFPALIEADVSICVGAPKAHWQGARYVAPRAGQADEFDASEWYLELFGENADAAAALLDIAEIGFWEPDKGTECLRFRLDPSRMTANLPLAERIAAAETAAASRTSSSRIRRF